MPSKTAKRISVREHPLESPVGRGMMHKRPLRAARRSVTAPLCCRLMEGANLVLSRAPLLEPVVRLVGWRGSNYRPGRSWCRCACHSDPCRVRNVRMVCVRLPAVKFKRRVQATVWAGAFVRFAAFEVAGRLLGVLGSRALSRLRTSTLFKSPTAWGSPD
jgi:hypothetical protein